MTCDQHDSEALAPTACEMPSVPRRRFLTLAVLGAVSAAWSSTTEAAAAIPVRTLASPGLLALLGSEDAVRHLGERYRLLVPSENDAQVLVQAILTSSPLFVVPDLATALAAQIRDDFTHGRTVTVHGWILAVTEARQCALYSLHAA
jgi:hypothetical protein